ncbi:MAG: acyclic terpene utilization AtuA family protein [Betaproteobacteria bacterium]|nr:acyclic terpene utilization AtuA family protein [Betaproteobacteria bacterium]
MAQLKILAGHAFGQLMPEVSFRQALEWKPDVVVAQGTSTDCGPAYIGAGINQQPKPNVKRAFAQLLSIATRFRIPFIWSVGTGGTDGSLEWALDIFREVCTENNHKLRIAGISGELQKDYLVKKIEESPQSFQRLVETERLPRGLSKEEVLRSSHVIAQMGPEPIIAALEKGVDGVITGRALDIGLYMALPLKLGFPKALAAHLGKTMECGSIPSVPAKPGSMPEGASFDVMLGVLNEDNFLVFPANPELKCTVTSVGSHAFYERVNPFKEENPGGYLDLAQVAYEQIDERTVKCSGAKWVDEPYSIKVEGAAVIGYRAICIAGLRDPAFIRQIDSIFAGAKIELRNLLPLNPEDYQVHFHAYGRDAVMGVTEPCRDQPSHEIGLVIDAVGKTQEIASTAASGARAVLMGKKYPGRLSTAGNLALLYSPSELELGPAYIFNIWHKMLLDNPLEPFRYKLLDSTSKAPWSNEKWRSF